MYTEMQLSKTESQWLYLTRNAATKAAAETWKGND